MRTITVCCAVLALGACSGMPLGSVNAAPKAAKTSALSDVAQKFAGTNLDEKVREKVRDRRDQGVAGEHPDSPGATAKQKRLVIYKARLDLAVFKPTEVLAQARKIVKADGGWMEAMTSMSLTVRVPAAKLEQVLNKLAALGDETDRDIRGEDVTTEYLDLNIRLKNALKVRERLIVLLQQAKTVKDSVLIEKELGRLTEKIERFKGRLAYLKNHVAFSKITLRLERKTATTGRARRLPFSWLRSLGIDDLLRDY